MKATRVSGLIAGIALGLSLLTLVLSAAGISLLGDRQEAYIALNFGLLGLMLSGVLGGVFLIMRLIWHKPFPPKGEGNRLQIAGRACRWLVGAVVCYGLITAPAPLLVWFGSVEGTYHYQPYQSQSPGGRYTLDVKRIDDQVVAAQFDVIDNRTGLVVYACPDVYRVWDLFGIDWLQEGIVMVDSSDVGAHRYSVDEAGRWGSEYANGWDDEDQVVVVPVFSGTEVYRDFYVSVREQYGWHLVETVRNSGWRATHTMSFDAEGKLRIDTDHRRVTLDQLMRWAAQGNDKEIGQLHLVANERAAGYVYVTKDAFLTELDKKYNVISSKKLF